MCQEVFRVLIGNHSIFISVNDERRTLYFRKILLAYITTIVIKYFFGSLYEFLPQNGKIVLENKFIYISFVGRSFYVDLFKCTYHFNINIFRLKYLSVDCFHWFSHSRRPVTDINHIHHFFHVLFTDVRLASMCY